MTTVGAYFEEKIKTITMLFFARRSAFSLTSRCIRLFSPPVERQNEKCKVVILHEPLFSPSDAIVGVSPEGCLSIESGKNALKVDFQPFTLFSRSVLTLIQKLASDMQNIRRLTSNLNKEVQGKC
jgi:hypothetical protein